MTGTSFQEHDHPVQEKKMQEYLSINLSLRALFNIAAQPNRCFDNAWRTFLSSPEMFTDGTFVEGWIVFNLEDEVVLNEHGWCELADGTIVDPSLLLLVEPDQPVYYFPGVKRGWEEVKSLVQREQSFPYVRFDGKHGEDGLGHLTYQAAHDAALQKIIKLANAQTPPKKMTLLTAQDIEKDTGDAGISIHIIVFSPEKHKGETSGE